VGRALRLARPLADIVPLEAGPGARQQVIADRAAAGGEVVEVNRFAEQLDPVARLNPVLGQVGDVDDCEP